MSLHLLVLLWTVILTNILRMINMLTWRLLICFLFVLWSSCLSACVFICLSLSILFVFLSTHSIQVFVKKGNKSWASRELLREAFLLKKNLFASPAFTSRAISFLALFIPNKVMLIRHTTFFDLLLSFLETNYKTSLMSIFLDVIQNVPIIPS